jgi:hypothetical protein
MDNGNTAMAESTAARGLSEPSYTKSVLQTLETRARASNVEVEPPEPSLLETHSEKDRGEAEDDASVVPETVEKDLEAQTPDSQAAAPDNETKLQDQTNILPFKQLAIVFLGLACALFCEFWLLILFLFPRFSSHG